LTPLRLAIALLLDEPSLAPAARAQGDDWRELDNPGVQLLAELLAVIDAHPDIGQAALRERWRETERNPFVEHLSDSGLIAHIPESGREDELIGAIAKLNRAARKERRWRLLAGARGGLSAEQLAELRAGNEDAAER
jgi:DNA primase